MPSENRVRESKNSRRGDNAVRAHLNVCADLLRRCPAGTPTLPTIQAGCASFGFGPGRTTSGASGTEQALGAEDPPGQAGDGDIGIQPLPMKIDAHRSNLDLTQVLISGGPKAGNQGNRNAQARPIGELNV